MLLSLRVVTTMCMCSLGESLGMRLVYACEYICVHMSVCVHVLLNTAAKNSSVPQ